MREASPEPADIRYATRSLTPSTSRNWRASAPGTTPALQVAPPSVVRAYVPATPLAQTTCGLTGLIACSRLVVPLCCGVTAGAVASEAVARANAGAGAAVGADASEQVSVGATTNPVTATAIGRGRERSI